MTAAERAQRAADADALCGKAYEQSGGPAVGAALVAVGGYGRAELAPYSDLDVVLVSAEGVDVREVAEQVWYPLWDSGSKLDHSVRTLPEMVSLVIWAAILLDFWVERRRRIRPLAAFVLPVVLALGLGLPSGLRSIVFEGPVPSGWVMVHVALVLVGLAALVLNFGGALMYLLVERQLKAKRPGAGHTPLPPLERLDRLTVATLTVAFPFLTVGLALGALSARGAGAGVAPFDPLVVFSILMWLIYAATLLGRVIGHVAVAVPSRAFASVTSRRASLGSRARYQSSSS